MAGLHGFTLPTVSHALASLVVCFSVQLGFLGCFWVFIFHGNDWQFEVTGAAILCLGGFSCSLTNFSALQINLIYGFRNTFHKKIKQGRFIVL